MFDLEDELKKLPAKPGVYIMHDRLPTSHRIGHRLYPYDLFLLLEVM